MPSEHVKTVTTLNFDDEVAKSTVPVIVDFWAAWCGPCKMLAPLLDEIADENIGKLKVVKVDVDTEGELAQKFSIQSIPTLLFFKDGSNVGHHIGLSSKKDLLAKIQAAV